MSKSFCGVPSPSATAYPNAGEHREAEHDRDGSPNASRSAARPLRSRTPTSLRPRVSKESAAQTRARPPRSHQRLTQPKARERPEDEDELHPADDVRGEEERRGRTRREQARDAQRSERQQRAPGEERERPGHRPLAEKCW